MDPEIKEIFSRHTSNSRESLLPILQDIQEHYGHLTEEAINTVAKRLQIPASKIYGVASFYEQFHFDARGQYHIKVCDGTNCNLLESYGIVKEIKKILNIEAGEVSRDGLYSLETCSCLGACAHGPVMQINQKYYAEVSPGQIKEILENLNDIK